MAIAPPVPSKHAALCTVLLRQRRTGILHTLEWFTAVVALGGDKEYAIARSDPQQRMGLLPSAASASRELALAEFTRDLIDMGWELLPESANGLPCFRWHDPGTPWFTAYGIHLDAPLAQEQPEPPLVGGAMVPEETAGVTIVAEPTGAYDQITVPDSAQTDSASLPADSTASQGIPSATSSGKAELSPRQARVKAALTAVLSALEARQQAVAERELAVQVREVQAREQAEAILAHARVEAASITEQAQALREQVTAQLAALEERQQAIAQREAALAEQWQQLEHESTWLEQYVEQVEGLLRTPERSLGATTVR